MKTRLDAILQAALHLKIMPMWFVFFSGILAIPFLALIAVIYVWGDSWVKLFKLLFSRRAFEFISLADTTRVTIFGEDISEGRTGAQDGCKETIN